MRAADHGLGMSNWQSVIVPEALTLKKRGIADIIPPCQIVFTPHSFLLLLFSASTVLGHGERLCDA